MPKKSSQLSNAERQPAPGGVAAVDKALTLLTCFQARDRALSLSDLAARCALHKSTCLRLLSSLIHAGFIHKTASGAYAVGPEVNRLQGNYLGGFALPDVVYPVLQALVKKTNESAAYSVIQGSGEQATRLCVYRVHSQQVLRDQIREGEIMPLRVGAGGRVLVAFAGMAESAAEKPLLDQIRRDGYCAAIGDRTPELAGVSAPVFHRNGAIAASLTLTMASSRYDARHIPHVVLAAQAISSQMP